MFSRAIDRPALFLKAERQVLEMSNSVNRNEIRKHLEENDLQFAVSSLLQDRKTLSVLIRLSYAKDTLVGWRAILAVGIAARELVLTDRAFLREVCRKLLWSLSDESGGIGWSSPELLGEIVSAEPRQFADLIPLIANVYDIEEKVFRPGVVYALRRIAESDPALVLEHQKVVIASLADTDPLVRVRGLELVGHLWAEATGSKEWSQEFQQRIRQAIDNLIGDREETWVYQGSGYVSIMVGETASNTINIIR